MDYNIKQFAVYDSDITATLYISVLCNKNLRKSSHGLNLFIISNENGNKQVFISRLSFKIFFF